MTPWDPDHDQQPRTLGPGDRQALAWSGALALVILALVVALAIADRVGWP